MLQQRLTKAGQLNLQLKNRILELEKYLESDETSPIKIDSHNSNLPPSLDLPWNKPKRTRSLRKKSGLKVGGQFGHQGATLSQVSNPDSIVVHPVESCSHCNFSLMSTAPAKFQKRQVFEIIGGKMNVIEHRVEIKQCSRCERISKADFPLHVKAPVQYGAAVFSRIVYLNQYQLLPVGRTAETMKDLFECPVSWATVQRASEFCGQKLVRCEQRIKAFIRESSVVGADETGIRVSGKINWVHVARTEDLTHFQARSKRGKEAFEAIGIITRFKGVLVRDGMSSYRRLDKCRHSLCNAHLLRDLTFVAENEPVNKTWTDELAKLLLNIKDAVFQAKSSLN